MRFIAYANSALIIVLFSVTLYYGTFNHNMSFLVNMYSALSYMAMKFMFKEGREQDKTRFSKIRNMITPPNSMLKRYKGIVSAVTQITVRDGTKIDLYTYTPSLASDNPRKLVFFCHGGGWVMANRGASERILCEYALKSNSVITYVNYRLAPEYVHPTAVYDCYDCLMYMISHKEEFHIDSNSITLMGDSAGGMICCAIIQLAIEQFHTNIFLKNVLIYPAMDSRAVPSDDPSWEERKLIFNNTLSLTYRIGGLMSEWYFEKDEAVGSPLGSPALIENFDNFPITRFFTCEYDTLKIAARETYQKMKVVFVVEIDYQDAGVDVKYYCAHGAVHGIWGAKYYDCGLNELVLKELM